MPAFRATRTPDRDPAQLRTLRRIAQRGAAKLVAKNGDSVEIPTAIRALLAEIARGMEAGKSVSVVTGNHELTTQRAANILGVSRPFLIRLLEERKIPFHMAGTHRRIYLADLLSYKAIRDRARHRAIRDLARADVEAGIYDVVTLPDGSRDE